MLGMVLVLAGVTAADGGLRAGAATAPVAEPLKVDFSHEWRGIVSCSPKGWDYVCVRLDRGRMTFYAGWKPYTEAFDLTLSHGGLALCTWGEDHYHGTYKVERDRLLVCLMPVEAPRPAACTSRDGYLFTLQPAARRR